MTQTILDYEDWKVYYENGEYIFKDMYSGDTKKLRLVATLTYTDTCYEPDLWRLFDNYCCGEQVTDDKIIYYWFKEMEEL